MADQRRDPEQRPSPEALLAEARREEKGRAGRLKIFVGAAPGVGKTYEMLQTARAKLKEGVDVVVGVVETHGRKETEALLEGLEVIPRKPTVYVNRILNEFDLDAALKRRPSLILVDELAHTNIPGQPASQALPGRRGAAGCRHRRLHHGQHPAHREPERRRGADHARARARDRAGLHPRSRRRHRAGRSDARRPDPAPEGRQGLRSQAGRAGAQALFLARQPHRACASWPCGARPSGWTSSCSSRCRRAPSRGRGRRASASSSASARIRARPASCATPSAWPIACTRPGRRSASRPGAACSSARRSATASPRRCGWPSASVARPSPSPRPARRIADDVLELCAQEQRHPHHHRQVHALALVRDPAWLGRARPGAAGGQHQRPRHRRRGSRSRADPAKVVSATRVSAVRSAALHRRPAGRGCWPLASACCSDPCSASRTSTSYS